MKWKEFKADIAANNLSLRKFAAMVGKEPAAVRQWSRNKNGVPRWVESWLTMWSWVPRDRQQEILKNLEPQVSEKRGP